VTTKKDFSFMGGFLMVGILLAFLAGLGAIFFEIPALSLTVSAAFVLLMSGLILYETSNIIHGGETNYVHGHGVAVRLDLQPLHQPAAPAGFLDFETAISELEEKIDQLRFVQDDPAVDISDEIKRLEAKSQSLTKDLYAKLSPWQIAQVARHPQRPYTLDYASLMFTDFHELHGDRNYADDKAIVGGLARFNGQACVVIGHQKGRDTKEKIARNFGMPRPEGYRKALRLMNLAEKFALPVFTFVDTPGAYPGIGAEERGQSEAIGRKHLPDGRAQDPDHQHHHRRGRLGRRARDRGRRPRADAAVLDLLGDLARRLRLDPLEERREGRRGGRDHGHHRGAPEVAGS
jgi:hypothetical protein